MFARSLYISLPLLITLFACSGNTGKKEGAVARVYDEYLGADEVAAACPGNLEARDSIAFVKAYIKNWVKNKVIESAARKNIGRADEARIEQQVETYRQSLMVYTYQNNLLSQELDTTISDENIRAYYEENKNNFELKQNLVRLRFVKIRDDVKQLDEIRKMFMAHKNSETEKLTALCSQYASNFFLDDETWLDFNEITKELPLTRYNDEHFLRNNEFIDIREGNYIYLVQIVASRIKNSLSSLDFEKENIRKILLNKRKIQLLQTIENNLLKEAETGNKVEIFETHEE